MDEQDTYSRNEEEEDVDINQILHELTEIWEREGFTIAGLKMSYEDIVEIIDRNPHYLKFIDYMIIEEMNKEHELVEEPDSQDEEDWESDKSSQDESEN